MTPVLTARRLAVIAALAVALPVLLLASAPYAANTRSLLYISATGSDAGSCTSRQPCASFDRAHRLASPGTIVDVAGGTYPGQTIGHTPRRAGAAVIFRPAAGASVTVGGSGITVHGANLEFRDMRVTGGLFAKPGARNVTFRRITAKDLFIVSASDIRMIGGSVGPGTDYHPIIGADGTVPPRRILIDGVRFHDWKRTNDSVHIECLQILAGDGIVIRNSRFINCDVMALFVGYYGDAGLPRNVTVENNVFGSPGSGGHYAIQTGVLENLLLRNNSSTSAFWLNNALGPKKNVRVIGNVAPNSRGLCVGGVRYRHNVWAGARCSPTDRNGPSRFVDASNVDLRLRTSSPAVDGGDPTDYPRVDIAGRRRPAGNAPDAGAYESH